MAGTLILKRPVVAVTGSAGKSTTKEMIAAILSSRWKTFKTQDNLNFWTHTQQYAKQIKPAHKAVVLEYGISGPGQLRRHCQLIRPNVSVITNIGTAHIGSFGGDVQKLGFAKSEIVRYMDPHGTFIRNYDDANSKYIKTGRFKGKTITFGLQAGAAIHGKNIRYSAGGMQFDVRLDATDETFFIPIYGRQHVCNALAAIAVGRHLGFSTAAIRRGLRNFVRLQRRLVVRRLNRHILLIDDSFSSNPNAAIASIDVLKSLGKGSRIAVLGSMLALGQYTVRGHKEVGRHLAKHKGVDWLFTYGQYAKRIGEAAVAGGFARQHVRHFTSRKALHAALLKHVTSGSTVLVKGSHGVGMKETVEYLTRYVGRAASIKRPSARKK